VAPRVAVVGYGPVGILFRALVCLIRLLPPSVLMGATLPAISRWLETTGGGTSRMGLFLHGDPTSRIEENPALETSLAEVKIEGVLRLLAAYVGWPRDLAQWLEDAQINQERNLRLQYLAGLSINLAREQEVYREIVQYRRYPDDIFTVPIWMERRLKSVWN
jgi:hypothetical protein